MLLLSFMGILDWCGSVVSLAEESPRIMSAEGKKTKTQGLM